MSVIVQGVKLQCDKCHYVTDATFDSAKHAREVLGGRQWVCVQVRAYIGPDVTRDFCRVCVTTGRVHEELKTAKAAAGSTS